MKYAPKKVFILDKGSYTEISYQEFCECREKETSFTKKRFIPVQGMLLEVSEAVYTEFYREKERNRYLDKLDEKNGLVSLESVIEAVKKRENSISALAESIVDIVIENLLRDKLRGALNQLTVEEQELVYQLYYRNLTEREVAKKLRISQVAVNKRKHRILEKLKKIMES